MTIHEAIRKLRDALDLTQQAFAVQLGISVSAVQKYERDREPDLGSAMRLAHLAQEAGLLELEDMFMGVLRDSFEATNMPGVHTPMGAITYGSPREWLYLRATQLVLNDKRFQDRRPLLEEALRPAAQHLHNLRSRINEANQGFPEKVRKARERMGSKDEDES